jgi:uncharacterized ubiquitin-like protein YukD
MEIFLIQERGARKYEGYIAFTSTDFVGFTAYSLRKTGYDLLAIHQAPTIKQLVKNLSELDSVNYEEDELAIITPI